MKGLWKEGSPGCLSCEVHETIAFRQRWEWLVGRRERGEPWHPRFRLWAELREERRGHDHDLVPCMELQARI